MTAKLSDIDMWLLLDTNGKSYRQFNYAIEFNLEWPWTCWRSIQYHLDFEGSYLIKELSLAIFYYYMYYAPIANYMGIPISASYLTLSDLKRSNSRSHVFWLRSSLGYMCATSGSFWPLAKFHAQRWQFWKSSCILETAVRRVRMISISSPWVRKRIYVPLLESWPMAKFQGQIWQFWKSAIISETAAHTVKICSISTSWDRKRVYVQLLELWPMAKFVLKQSVKAHGPLVLTSIFFLLVFLIKILYSNVLASLRLGKTQSSRLSLVNLNTDLKHYMGNNNACHGDQMNS